MTTGFNPNTTQPLLNVQYSLDNPCALRGCSECCRNMSLQMTWHEFISFCGNDITPSWLSSQEAYEAKKLEDSARVYYYIPRLQREDFRTNSPFSVYKMRPETLGSVDPNMNVIVLINSNCPMLKEGACRLFRTGRRPGVCGQFPFNGSACQEMSSNFVPLSEIAKKLEA